jgi:CyaY protein
MTETEFLDLADATLEAIEAAAEALAQESDLDIEVNRRGNVLELELDGGKVIVNSQAPMQEMWLAARAGGFHYRRENGQWVDTRSGKELFAALSEILSQQLGEEVKLGSAD